jgi:hypothetical protein
MINSLGLAETLYCIQRAYSRQRWLSLPWAMKVLFKASNRKTPTEARLANNAETKLNKTHDQLLHCFFVEYSSLFLFFAYSMPDQIYGRSAKIQWSDLLLSSINCQIFFFINQLSDLLWHQSIDLLRPELAERRRGHAGVITNQSLYLRAEKVPIQ